MYCKQRRDPRCTYGKKIFSARYWEDATRKCKSYPISFSRTFKSNLSVPSQFQISQVFSEYTKYNILNEHEVPIIIQDFGTVEKVYRLDPYFSSSNIPKYTYLYTRSSYKNTKEKYTTELPSEYTKHYKFFNIYYEGDDDIYQDAIKESDYESSLHDFNKENQGNNKNKQGQKLSGTFSTEKKNKNFCGTSHTYDKCPTVHDVQKLYRKDPEDISTYGDKNISKMPTVNYKSPVEYARTAQTRTLSPRSKMYHGFNYFEDRKQRSRKLITPTAKFLKNDHTNNTNDLNPELFENNQDHHKRSLSYDDHDLCTTHSVSSHETLRTFPFLIKKKYAKSNRQFFRICLFNNTFCRKERGNIERSETYYDFVIG